MKRAIRGDIMNDITTKKRRDIEIDDMACLLYFIIPIVLIVVWFALIPSIFWMYWWWLPLLSGIVIAMGFADCIDALEWMNEDSAFRIIVSFIASSASLMVISFFLITTNMVEWLLVSSLVAIVSSGYVIYIRVICSIQMP
jgi:hypothetical protein